MMSHSDKGGEVILAKHTHLGYKYRADGNYLIRKICRRCGVGFDLHALSNSTPQSSYGLCDTCEAARQMEVARQVEEGKS